MIELHQITKLNRVQFTQLCNCLIEYNMLNYDCIKSDNKTEQSSVYSIM